MTSNVSFSSLSSLPPPPSSSSLSSTSFPTTSTSSSSHKRRRGEELHANVDPSPDHENGAVSSLPTSSSSPSSSPSSSSSSSLPPPPVPLPPFGHLPRSPIVLSHIDSSKGLQVLPSRLEVIGEKGYRLVSSTHGISVGSLYWEFRMKPHHPPMKINNKVMSPHCRVGFCTIDADRNAPVGSDIHGYSIRDSDSFIIHDGTPQEYVKDNTLNAPFGFGVGDVIGCHILLPPDIIPMGSDYVDPLAKMKIQTLQDANNINSHANNSNSPLSNSNIPQRGGGRRKKKPTEEELRLADESKAAEEMLARDFAGHIDPDTLTNEQKSLLRYKQQLYCLNSKITFYSNGKSLGVAFKNLFKGIYFPAVSLYMAARVECNFGPNFWRPPIEFLERGIQGAKIDKIHLTIEEVKRKREIKKLKEKEKEEEEKEREREKRRKENENNNNENPNHQNENGNGVTNMDIDDNNNESKINGNSNTSAPSSSSNATSTPTPTPSPILPSDSPSLLSPPSTSSPPLPSQICSEIFNYESKDFSLFDAVKSQINWMALAQSGLFPHLADSKISLIINPKHQIQNHNNGMGENHEGRDSNK